MNYDKIEKLIVEAEADQITPEITEEILNEFLKFDFEGKKDNNDEFIEPIARMQIALRIPQFKHELLSQPNWLKWAKQYGKLLPDSDKIAKAEEEITTRLGIKYIYKDKEQEKPPLQWWERPDNQPKQPGC